MTIIQRQLEMTDLNGHNIAPEHAPHPLAILDAAVRNNADVTTLKEISALAKEWKAEAAREAFSTAMAAAQAEMPTVVQDKVNTHTSSRYASFETIQRLIKPVYLRHGFTVSFSEDGSPRDGWVCVKAQVRHIGGHTEYFERTGPIDNVGAKGNPTKTALHGVASTVTYLSRHLLCGVFSVTVAGEDKDGNDGNRTSKTITSEQMAELNQMIKDTGSDVTGFLAYLECSTMSELTFGDYLKGKLALEK
jgi:hypothetical protein